MKGKKLFRFAEIKTFDNVFEYPEDIQNQWKDIFRNENELVLELACGKGEYSVNMASAFPDKNFIGVDVKGNRMYVGAKMAIEKGISNVIFLRTRIEGITQYFLPNSISEIWITFPDPFLRDSKAKNRLTHHKFLAMYQQMLKPDGIINLKTDSKELFTFTLEMIEHHKAEILVKNDDVYKNGTPDFPLNIQTFYEGLHLADGRTIQYVSFRLPKEPIVVPPKKSLHEETSF